MNKSNGMEAEIQALRERLSKLCAAVLRISASLDLDTVLREVVASARALTGARYGVITIIDKAGQVQDFVTSGITPDEHRQLAAWPDGMRPKVWRGTSAPQSLRANIRLRWFTTPYKQPDPLPNSAKICPIKPNHFSTEPSSNDRLAEALRTRNPRWTTRTLWYPPAQSRRHLPNAGAAVGQRDAPGTASAMPAVNRPAYVELPSGDAAIRR